LNLVLVIELRRFYGNDLIGLRGPRAIRAPKIDGPPQSKHSPPNN